MYIKDGELMYVVDADVKNGYFTAPEEVTKIGYSALRGLKHIRSVLVGANVRRIEKYAFYRCETLERVVIYDGVVGIGKYAFSGCKGLISLTIPATVETIGGFACSDCENLTEVTIDANLKVTGYGIFKNCDNLQVIRVSGDYSDEQIAQLKSGLNHDVEIIKIEDDSSDDETPKC